MAMTLNRTMNTELQLRKWKISSEIVSLVCEKLLNHSRQRADVDKVAIAWAFIKKMFRVNSPKNSNIVEMKNKQLSEYENEMRVNEKF